MDAIMKEEKKYGKSFTAKWGNSWCPDCGKPLYAGDEVRYRYPEKSLCHLDCEVAQGRWVLSGGEGYGCHGWEIGQVVYIDRTKPAYEGYPEFLLVVDTKEKYFSVDGLSFGVGDDSGYKFTAYCRAASDEEAASLKQKIEQQNRRYNATCRLDEIGREIKNNGEKPVGPSQMDMPEGEMIFVADPHDELYGGGWWIIANDDYVWYIENHGMDGDFWAANNIRTGGAGALGWRVSRNEDLVSELNKIKEILETGK